MEFDRREIGWSPQEGQLRRRVDVSVVVRGWCLAPSPLMKGMKPQLSAGPRWSGLSAANGIGVERRQLAGSGCLDIRVCL